MSIFSEKESIVNQIATYSSIAANNGNSKKTNSLSSLNNGKDPIPFLLDIIVVLGGAIAIDKLLGKLFPQVLTQIEFQLKQILLSQVRGLPNSNLPVSSVPAVSNGITVPMKDLDLSDKYKIQVNDPSYGSTMYPANSFDNKIKSQVMTSSTPIMVNGLSTTYNSNNENFKFIPPQNQSIELFLNGYINSMQIINKNEFILCLLDMIFGTFSSIRKKSVQKLIEEEKLNKIIDNITSEEINESVFIFNKEELDEIEGIAKMKSVGVVSVDMGCGYANLSLSEDEFKNSITGLTGTTNTVDILSNIFNTASSDSDGNKSSMKDGFMKILIHKMTILIVKNLLFTPQMVLFRNMIQTFTHKTTQSTSTTPDELKKNSQYVDTISKGSKGIIISSIFDFTSKMISQLVKNSSNKILQEKTLMYFKILTSLRP